MNKDEGLPAVKEIQVLHLSWIPTLWCSPYKPAVRTLCWVYLAFWVLTQNIAILLSFFLFILGGSQSLSMHLHCLNKCFELFPSFPKAPLPTMWLPPCDRPPVSPEWFQDLQLACPGVFFWNFNSQASVWALFFPQASIFVCPSILLLMKPRALKSYLSFPNIIWQLPRLATISSVGSRLFWPTITMRYLKFIGRRWAGGIRFLYLSWLVAGDYFSQNFESCTVTGNLLCGCGTLNVIAPISS